MSRYRPPAPQTPARRRDSAEPLLVTADDLLLNELSSLSAAADVQPVVARDPFSALPQWTRAPVVLVGADLAAALAEIVPESRPHCIVVSRGPAPDQLFRTALALGADQVVDLTGSAGWLAEQLSDLTEHRPGRGRVIGVIGGSGGAGATTFACALGQQAARSGRAVLIDCDPQGPGLDRMLGMERVDGFRWDALCRTTGRLSARALREALPHRGALGVLSWYADAEPQTLQAFAVREALSAARRGHDTVIVDLPRSPDPLIDELVTRCDQLLVVVTASVLGLASAARLRPRFADHADPAVVLRGEAFTATQVARSLGLPVRVQMRDHRGLAEALDLGLGPLRSFRGPLARATAQVLQAGVGQDAGAISC